jgi:hypothetical protein
MIAPPVAPLCPEHQQVECVPWLDLDPLAAAAASAVGSIERLDDNPFVAAFDGRGEELLGLG